MRPLARNLQVAIIADDLTGALDTTVPFAMAGLSVCVATDLQGLSAALRLGCEVVAVNTASRALAATAAAAKAFKAASELAELLPEVILKKVDSRLKGNVSAETQAVAEAAGRAKLVVALAVPDQQRIVRDGHVLGRGVLIPLSIAKAFTGNPASLVIIDSGDQQAMHDLVQTTEWGDVIAVGARGLGLAFAAQMGRPRAAPAFSRSMRTLFAFGSRDPLTQVQMETLLAEGAIASVTDAPDGMLPQTDNMELPGLLRCTGELSADPAAVADRFAAGVVQRILLTRPDVLMLGGGDTASAILRHLGTQILVPVGEFSPGMPWCELSIGGDYKPICVFKSGGFGSPRTLLQALFD